ncbi:hypothetical protein BSL84_27560 [Streptomyces sp. TN58]|nr:hypothetical protein BSL84_27560 [Streptomyces sp. TN58]
MSPLGPTLFQTLINQRGWQDYTVFKKRYEQAAKQLADAEGDPSIATATVEKRQFHRWLRGDVRTPQTVSRRVLEFMFPGFQASRLLEAVSSDLGPVWSSDQEFSRSPARGGSVLIDRQSWREAISPTSSGP